MAWLDITNDLTKKGQDKLRVGQVLIFSYEGSPIHLKIMRKRNGKVWAKKNYIYHPNEVQITDKKKIFK
jgi:hypothetical protein